MSEYFANNGLGWIRVTPDPNDPSRQQDYVASPFASQISKLTMVTPEYVATPVGTKLSSVTMASPSQIPCKPPCREGAICLNGRCVRPGTPPPPPARDIDDDFEIPPEENGYEDLYANGNGNGPNWLLFGGIAVLLAAIAGGGYYYWSQMREKEEE